MDDGYGVDIRTLRAKFKALAPALNERSRGLWCATDAKALGRGGITVVARATRLSASTIARGIKELESVEVLAEERVRRPESAWMSLSPTRR